MAKKKKPDKKYRETLKYNLWVKYFLGLEGDPKVRKETFGNATQSVIKAYKLDPIKQYGSAGTIGWENLKKLENTASIILEKQGLTFGRLMEIGAEKMQKGGYGTWERFMERVGYFEPRPSRLDVTSAGKRIEGFQYIVPKNDPKDKTDS